jgi:16S rRNA (cytosine1402-N4)-methyltransferase
MKHIPVMKNELLELIAPLKNQNFIDATLGTGGHALEVLKYTAPNGKLLGIDQDEIAIETAKNNLAKFGERASFARINFTELGLFIREWKVGQIDGIYFDLGPSTDQLKSSGFSFMTDGPLDMRANLQSQKETAADIVNKYPEKEIIKVLFAGEEKFAKKIAQNIVHVRKNHPIESTLQLVEIIKKSLPPKYRHEKKTHFATDTFRALRMAVNSELENLESVLPQAVKLLSENGKIAVITFHSLEDRIVKNFFRENIDLEILTTKPITASEEEVRINPSARSAKLRVAIKK